MAEQSTRPGKARHPNNLKRAIEASGRKRKWLAAQLEVSRMTLHNYEHGRYPVPAERRALLQRLLAETPLVFSKEEIL